MMVDIGDLVYLIWCVFAFLSVVGTCFALSLWTIAKFFDTLCTSKAWWIKTLLFIPMAFMISLDVSLWLIVTTKVIF